MGFPEAPGLSRWEYVFIYVFIYGDILDVPIFVFRKERVTFHFLGVSFTSCSCVGFRSILVSNCCQ